MMLFSGQNNTNLCKLKYTDYRRRVEQVIQRAQFVQVVNAPGLWGSINYYIVVKQSTKQALRKYGVHWLSSAE